MTPINIYLAFACSFLVLYLVSRSLKIRIMRFLYKITKSKKISVYLFSVIFLPGTYLHEIAHFLVAQILGVHAEGLEITPEVQKEGHIKLGSVKIAKTDPVRRFFIGVAPFIIGILIIFTTTYFAYERVLEFDYYIWGALFYVLFVVGNTMFSSKKDLEVLWVFLIILSIIVLPLIYLNSRYDLGLASALESESSLGFFKLFIGLFGLLVAVDLVVIFCVFVFEKVYDILFR